MSLLPCPFCGSRAEVVHASHIRCTNTYNCDGESRLGEAGWNRRARRPFSDQLAQEVIDGQVKEIDRLTKLVQDSRSYVSRQEINQCDGCQRGLPIRDGKHDLTGVGSYRGEVMACTANRYVSQDAKDAARWRWFRDQLKTRTKLVNAQALFWNCEPSRSKFDKAVDAEISRISLGQGKE